MTLRSNKQNENSAVLGIYVFREESVVVSLMQNIVEARDGIVKRHSRRTYFCCKKSFFFP